MSWRDDPITQKQKDLIQRIETDTFVGKTKGEASDYIKTHLRTQDDDIGMTDCDSILWECYGDYFE